MGFNIGVKTVENTERTYPPEAAERPGIDEDTGPKKERNHNDVGSQSAAGLGHVH